MSRSKPTFSKQSRISRSGAIVALGHGMLTLLGTATLRTRMIVNVCPSNVANAPLEQVWQVIATPERYGEWVDANVVAVEPPGTVMPGQRIQLAAPFMGRHWPATIDLMDVDPGHRWADLRAHLPFGVVNNEHLTLMDLDLNRTLIRFN